MSYALRDNQIQEFDEDESDVELGDPNSFFGSHINLIPLHSSVQGPRLFYGARFYNQAMPLEKPEAPLVQNRIMDQEEGGDRSFDQHFGAAAGAVFSKDDGEVVDVTPDYIKLRLPDGSEKQVDLYNRFPFNRKSSIHNTAKVNKGDLIKSGQLLAKSNYTDDEGTLAMGVNAKVGLVPYEGWSLDDAVVISEDFAQRLKSEHSYTEEVDFDRDRKKGLNHFISLFPDKYTKKQREPLDDDGVIKPGTIVHAGDPLILATTPKTLSSSTAQIGKLSKLTRHARSDASVVWDHDTPGLVTDVARTKKGVKVVTQTYAPAMKGDKIVARSGQKGVISSILPRDQMPRTTDGEPLEVLLNPLGLPCVDDETEFLTDNGWVKAPHLTKNHKLATLNRATFDLEFQNPEQVTHQPYKGLMYRLCNRQLDMLITPGHKQFSAPRSKPYIYGTPRLDEERWRDEFELLEVSELFGQARRFLKVANWKGVARNKHVVAPAEASVTGPKPKGFEVSMHLWVRFMGWFLSEGYTTINHGKKGDSYVVGICQSKEVNPEKYAEIDQLLLDMGLTFSRRPKEFVISSKSLYEELCVFGKARDKWIPREILDLPAELLSMFVSTIMKGDGNTCNNVKTGHVDARCFTTSSARLAGGLQEILLKLGIAANVRRENRRGDQACYYMSLQKTSGRAPWINFSEKTKKNQVEEWVQYDGMVHCATVPNGVLLMRRDGKAVFTGNSRVNNSLVYELVLGKIAKKMGRPLRMDAFNKKGQAWYQQVMDLMEEHGVSDVEDLFDPRTGSKLENPVTVGDAYILKLHHTSASKSSARGQGSYDSDLQPAQGGGPGAGSKRFSGLEVHSMLSAGAYNTLREGATLRGQKNDEYWRQLRQGYTPREPGEPFVWQKFKTLLAGAGMQVDDRGSGKLRLRPMTDDDLDKQKPMTVRSGKSVNMSTLEPYAGGLFDSALVGSNKWGKIELPEPVPNPVFEDQIRQLLGLTEKQLRAILAGEEELPERLRK